MLGFMLLRVRAEIELLGVVKSHGHALGFFSWEKGGVVDVCSLVLACDLCGVGGFGGMPFFS